MRIPILLVLLAAACSPEPPPVPPPPAPAPAPRAPDLISFEAPAAWVKEPPSNSMRRAQYRVPDKEQKAKDAELAVTTSRVSVPLEENIGRWSAQVGGAEGKVDTFQGWHKVSLVDFSGPYASDSPDHEPIQGARLLVAVVETAEGPWYFKLVGPAETVGDWRDEFVMLLKNAQKK